MPGRYGQTVPVLPFPSPLRKKFSRISKKKRGDFKERATGIVKGGRNQPSFNQNNPHSHRIRTGSDPTPVFPAESGRDTFPPFRLICRIVQRRTIALFFSVPPAGPFPRIKEEQRCTSFLRNYTYAFMAPPSPWMQGHESPHPPPFQQIRFTSQYRAMKQDPLLQKEPFCSH